MPRTSLRIWEYACDATTPDDDHPCDSVTEVGRGDACNTRRGTVVHDQADADEVARQLGWTIGRRAGRTHVVCPEHGTGGAS